MALPSDILFDLPRITIIGQIHIYIENHHGIEQYSETELILKSQLGLIHIYGSSFMIKMMYPEEILLEGKIEEVKFTPRES